MRTTPDTNRLGRGVSFPGIDPRLWITLAVITDRGVDPNNGVYVDIQTIPAGDKDTCLVGSGYVGNGYGAWLPLAVGDLVAVALPRGDSAMGPIVFARLWSGSDKPPPELGTVDGAEPPDAPVIVLGPGQTAKIVCRPGASVEIVSDVNPLADPVVLATPVSANYTQLKAALDAVVLALNGLAPGTQAAWNAAMTGWPQDVAAGQLKVT